MKKYLLTTLLLCICGTTQAEEYTTLTVSGDTQAEGTANGAGTTAAQTGEGAGDAAAVPPPVVSVAPDPLCAAVTCSYQGSCVVSNGRPVCACNGGFAPGGPDGLSCLPYAPPVAVLQAPAYADPERDAALAQFYSVLPGYSAERDYARYARLKQYGRFTGTFPQFMEKRFRGQKGGGIAMLAVGGVLTAAAVSFLVVGFNADEIFQDCYGYDYYYGGSDYCSTNEEAQAVFLVFGTAFSIASVVMYSIGIPKLVIGSNRAKKMQQLSAAKTARPSGIEDFQLSFMQDPRIGAYGLAAGFKF